MKGEDKNIIQSEAPEITGLATVAMNKRTFDGTVWRQGYDLLVDHALKCPCKTKGMNNHLSNCRNCGSTGWVFYNRTKLRGIVYSMNWENAYKEWSEENLGNVYITVRDEDKLSFMDRVTVVDAETIHKQILYPFAFKGKCIAFTTYSIKSVKDIFLFQGPLQPLRRLIVGTDYTIGSGDSTDTCNGLTDNIIVFSEDIRRAAALEPDIHVTIVYIHPPQYHITHLIRDAMASVQLSGKTVRMPISAVGRRSHYVLDAENYNGDRLFDNSYLSCDTKTTH